MTSERLNLLIAEIEPAQARRERRESVGRSSGDTYEALLRHLVPNGRFARIRPVDADPALPPRADLAAFDGVFLTGSPLHLYQDTPETRRQVDFMRAVFAAGAPAFGSCAGLQLATVAAGGTLRSMGDRREAGFARRIFLTDAGRTHPLLAGRPAVYDAPAIHGDEVERLPETAIMLASNRTTRVQAAEIRCGEGVFWGVQYHPEISLREVAGALVRQADDLVEHGLAPSREVIEAHAEAIGALHHDPTRRDLLWRLGLDEQVSDPELRSREIRNFIEALILPNRSRRARGEAVVVGCA